MTKKDLQLKEKLINTTFDDNREIEHLSEEELRILNVPEFDENDLFKTDDGEFIYIHFQMNDFDVNEITYYVELAEHIYSKLHKKVSIYLLCHKNINVNVKESMIKSEAEFTIKLAKIEEDPAEIVHDIIKRKISNNEELNDDDMNALSMLPLICDINDRHYYRKEFFKLMNKIL